MATVYLIGDLKHRPKVALKGLETGPNCLPGFST